KETPMQGRAVNSEIALKSRGTYRIEIMGYDESGPRVVMNVPVRVGVDENDSEPGADAAFDPSLTEADAEAASLKLLNEERRRAGLDQVARDPELDEVARAHSHDMVDHGFLAHISPTTGDP